MMTGKVTNQSHSWFDVFLALLDWPFLLFVFLTIFVLLFRKKIVGLLERGGIQITWGDKQIKLKELSDGFDEEIDPIREDIQELREQIGKLSMESSERVKNISLQQNLNDKQWKDAELKILNGLKHSKYRWRSIERLAIISGVSESNALDILRSNSDVVLSIGKSKRQIARLKNRQH